MEKISSSSSEPIAAERTEDLLMHESKETSPLSSEAKATSKKRRLEEDEDSPAELGSGANSVTSVGSSSTLNSEKAPPSSKAINKKRRLEEDILTEQVSSQTVAGTSSVLAEIPLEGQGREPTPVPLKDHCSDNEPSVLDSSSEGQDTADNDIRDTAPNPTLPSPSLAEAHVEELDTDTRPSKKARLDIEPTATNPVPNSSISPGSTASPPVVISDLNITLQPNAVPKPSPLVVLPVELLSEILIYTGSPQHVLAVARTCKALCQTLLSTNNQFIWKMARKACVFDLEERPTYLPDPPQELFGEAAYAAFIFDSGACDVCGRQTNLMYTSFALRTRLCKDLNCYNSAHYSLGLIRAPSSDFTAITPFAESNACLLKPTVQIQPIYYPHVQEYCRALDYDNARNWIENSTQDHAFREKYVKVLAHNTKWMEFAVSVHKWSRTRQVHYYAIKNYNEAQSKDFAEKFGWDRLDMINSTVYGNYLKQKNKVMEKVQETDVRVMVDQIESQLLALSEKRGRHAAEVAFLKNRSDVEKYYNSIRSSKVYPILPSLPTFRHLPIINLLQSAPPTQGITISQTLASNPLMRGLLSDQLKQWVETAKDDFAVLLGFPQKWKNASKKVVHPVERATARFRCIRCSAKAKGGRRTDDGCLDFEAACKHVCGVGQGRIMKGKKGKWDVSNFVKDEKAIHALNKIIQALGYSADKDDARIMIAQGLAVLCTSCDPPMVIDSRSVVGHCHRHDAMELSLTFSVDTIASYLGGYPFTFGLTEKLLGPEALSIKGKNVIASKNFGCRHCLRAKQVGPVAVIPDVAAENEDGDGNGEVAGGKIGSPEAVEVELSTIVCRMHDRGVQGPKERPPPLFNFNGMVSHLKAKHRIESIRDEDFFCYDAVDFDL